MTLNTVMLSICAECLCLVSFMLSVANKPIMLSIVRLNIVMLSVLAPILGLWAEL
jgi:hypothetical protein